MRAFRIYRRINDTSCDLLFLVFRFRRINDEHNPHMPADFWVYQWHYSNNLYNTEQKTIKIFIPELILNITKY